MATQWALEALEPRILLSADLVVTAPGLLTSGQPTTITVSLAAGVTLAAPVHVTPFELAANGVVDCTAAGSPTATWITLSNTTRSATFRYTPGVNGVVSLAFRDDGSLVDPAPLSLWAAGRYGAIHPLKGGNWSDPAVWPDGIVPGVNGRPADTVSIDYDLTMDVDVTLGASTTLATCLWISQYHSLTVTAGHALTVRGNVVQMGSGSDGHAVNFNSATLVFDSTCLTDPSQGLKWQITDGYFPTPPYTTVVNFNGTATAPCFVRSVVGGAAGMFSNGGNFGGGQVAAAYTRFYRVGDAANVPFGTSTDYRPSVLSLDHCQFDTCGVVSTATTGSNAAASIASGSASFIVTNCTFANSLATDPLRFNGAVGRTTGTWNVSNNNFDKAPTLQNTTGLTQAGNTSTAVTALTLTPASSSAPVGTPVTYSVALSGAKTLSGTVRVTPYEAGGSGAFSPAYVDLTNTTRSATFTYTASAAGARAILLGNNGNLVNPQAVAFTNAATAYTITGPSSATVGIASGVFTVALNGTVASAVTVTPATTGGGAFAPASVTLDATHLSAAFTYTPASTGSKTITFTNSGTLANPSAMTVACSDATAAPTTYTLSGPASGDVATVSGAFTVTLGAGSLAGTVRFTPQASNGDGVFTPAYVDLTDAVRSATFTYKPAKWGTRQIIATNNGALANPAGTAYVAKVQVGPVGQAPIGNRTPDLGGFDLLANGYYASLGQNVRGLGVDPNNAAIMNTLTQGGTKMFWVDNCTSSELGGVSVYGEPFNIVPGNQPLQTITATAYWQCSDVTPVTHQAQEPIPANPSIEGWYRADGSLPNTNPSSDQKMLFAVRNESTGGIDTLWENYAVFKDPTLGWQARTVCKFDLAAGTQRPDGWASVSACGTPDIPLCFTYPDAKAALDRNDHLGTGYPIRATIPLSDFTTKVVWPALSPEWSGYAPANAGVPAGARLRLSEAWYTANAANFTGLARVMIDTMYQNGIIAADGSTYGSGGTFNPVVSTDDRWIPTELTSLRTIPVSAFEVTTLQPQFTISGPTQGALGQAYTFTLTRQPGIAASFSASMYLYNYTDAGLTQAGNGTFSTTPVLDDAHHTATFNFTAHSAGTYYVVVNPGNGWLCPAAITFQSRTDLVPPAVSLSAISPSPRTAPVSQVTFTFSKPVTGFDLSDLLLTCNGVSTSLTPAATLTTTDNVTWTLGNLQGLTAAPGNYVLTLSAGTSGIADSDGTYLTGTASANWWTTTTAAGPGGRLYLAGNYLSGTTNFARLSSIVLDSNWNLVGGAVSHGDFNNAGMTAGGVNGSMYYSYNGPGLSPEVLTSNPTGYNAVTMGGFWANGTYPGHDRPASNQGANYAVAGLLRIDPNAAGAAVTVLGNGRAYDPANRYWGNTEEGAAFIPDVSGAFTGHANSFIGTQGSISNGCAFNTIWENDAPPDANLTDHADISNPVFTRGYNYGNTESDRDFELVGGKLWESQGTSFARRITWIDSSFAVHVFYQNNTGLFDGGNGMSNGGMAAGRVTIGGADCDAVWVYTNDGTRTRISRLADANNDGVADNVAVIYDASSSTVPGDDPSSTWGDMELLTSLAGTKFLLAVDAANNRLIVLQLKPDGTYAGGYATVLTLPAGTLSGTGFSLNNIEFDASYRTALLPGDANLDGIVDQADYTRWYNGYGSNGGWSNGDFNGDGLVDQADYTLWYNNYGATGAAAPAEQTSSDASASATAPTVAPTVEAVVSGAGVPSPLPVQASVAAAPSIRPISTVETPAGASASSAAASRRGLSWRMPMVPSADAVLDVLEMLSRRF